MSNYKADLSIDLRPGRWSTLTKDQLADLDGSAGSHSARGSIFNALQNNGDSRSLTENAVGGSGDDRLVGNAGALLEKPVASCLTSPTGRLRRPDRFHALSSQRRRGAGALGG